MPFSSKLVYNKNYWIVKQPILILLVVFLLMISALGLITFQRYRILKENKIGEINKQLDLIDSRLDEIFKNCRSSLLLLAMSTKDKNFEQRFDTVAKSLIKEYPYFKSLEIQPNGIVKKIYPLVGNEKALGLDLFNSTLVNKLEVEKAIKSRQLYFQGPFVLTEGVEAVVGRLPVFENEKFWGFTAVVIKFQDLLNIIVPAHSLPSNYSFQLAGINLNYHQEEYYIKGSDFSKKHIYLKSVNNTGDWTLYLADKKPVFLELDFLYPLVFSVILIIVTLILLNIYLKNQKKFFALINEQDTLLQSTKNKYKVLFDNAAIGIAKIDSITGEFIEANPFLCKMLGYTEDELKARKIKSIIHPDDVDLDRTQFKKFIAKEIDGYQVNCRYFTKNNCVINAETTVSPLDNYYVTGERKCHIKIISDVTASVKVNNELIATKEHYEDLINSIDGVVWEADIRNGFVCTFISNKLHDILGYTPVDTIGLNNAVRVCDEDKERIIDYYKTKLFKQKSHVLEYRVYHEDGHKVWIKDMISIEPSIESPEMIRGIMIDITKEKEAEELLSNTIDLINEQNKRLHSFSYIVSHNFRSHASNIEGLISLLNSVETEEERKDIRSMLEQVAKNLNSTILNLNYLTNIKTDISIERENLNLNFYILSVLQVLKNQINNKKAVINNKIKSDVYVHFTSAYLESILLNIISNSLRYADPNRQILIVIKGEKLETGFELSIIDNGLGIDLEKFGNKIFGLNQTFHGNKDARGMGLFITKNQIESLGGSIAIESTLGVGTIIKIFFKC